jgi:[acyl-carrier-protein] S-malonyltransferase
MADAAEAFRPLLEALPFGDPRIPLYSNVSGGEVKTGEEAKKLALRQITEPVRWTEVEGAVQGRGDIGRALEAGPGKVLQGLWKDTGTELPCLPAGTAADIAALAGTGD